MGWISPTGHSDPSACWGDETNAYNDNTANSAYENSIASPTGYLELTHAALSCDKVRFYTSTWYGTHTLDLDVYYSGAWHNIYSANPLEDQYVEVVIGSTESVTAMRIRASNRYSGHYINDTDFNEVAPPPPSYIPKVIFIDFSPISKKISRWRKLKRLWVPELRKLWLPTPA